MTTTVAISKGGEWARGLWASAIVAFVVLCGWLAWRGGVEARQLVGAVVSTFVSEDAACVTAGALAKSGMVHWWVAIVGCTVGIWLGDVGLWALGRGLGAQARRVGWVSRRLPPARMAKIKASLDARGGWAIVIARVVPGLRFPVYLASGVLGFGARRFAGWTALAAAVWAPLLVVVSAFVGGAALEALRARVGSVWALVAIAVLGAVVVRVGLLAASERGRARLVVGVSRFWRWEFWPMWAFYPPVVVWIGWLIVRYRGAMVVTAANPGIPLGGLVGESKHAILAGLAGEHVAASELIEGASGEARAAVLERVVAEGRVAYPMILKPDAGQRGAGVRMVRSAEEAGRYLASVKWPVVAQAFDPGPCEAGIFYCRYPDEESGWIFAVTDKVFPAVVGDGVSTLEELIWRDKRYRMQAGRFLERHAGRADEVIAAGERFALAMAGNHCQGTLFRDGSRLIRPELTRAIDAVAKRFDGFYFGRFDVRYADEAALMSGERFTVIELNGLTSEATNIYDPSWPVWRAWGVLFEQWRIAFEIGRRAVRRGARKGTWGEVLGTVRAWRREPHAEGGAD